MPAAPALPAVSARGQHFDLERIEQCLSFLLEGHTSLRAVPRLCRLCDAHAGLPGRAIPDWTTSRMWLMQLGLSRLRQPVVQADDWAWLVDHSVQLGRERCLVVLGLRCSELPVVGQPLRRQDVHLLHVQILRDPDMVSNCDAFLEVVRRTGPPRVLLSDHAADVRGGIRLLGERLGAAGARMLDVHDIKHRTALALKHRLQELPRWAEFLSGVGQTRNRLKQTEWAFLVPPVLRTKSRYLNLGELIPWAWKTRWLVEHQPAELLVHGDPQRLVAQAGWLLDFAEDLRRWRSWYRVAARTEEVVRNRGLYRGVERNLAVRLSGLLKDEAGREMAGELQAFVAQQSEKLQAGERIPGSTEVLESCFGTLKTLSQDQSRSGFTGLVLGLGAMVGKVSKAVVAEALRSTPVKAVRRWCRENIGLSLHSKRQEAYRLASVTNTE